MLTHDHVLFADGIAFFDDAPHLVTRADQGKEVAEALGDQDIVLLRNHGVLVVGKSLRWAVLRAITLERAIQLQSIAKSLGPLRPFPATLAKEIQKEKYQDHFIDEYWEAWIRQLRHRGHDHGMQEV
jgi:ribulose-5-phosphate 4-epimerase/fuculose-1-phosphate aldolase